MKKLLLIHVGLIKVALVFFMILNLINTTEAQVTKSESFDGATFLPTGWSAVGTTNLWTRRPNGTFPTCNNHSGAGMARFGSRGIAAKTTQTIATPVIDFTNRGANTPKVSLWIYRDNGSTLSDSLSLYLNTSTSLTSAVYLGTITRYSKLKMPDTVAANGWFQYSFNIPSGFSTATNYILFKGISENGYNIYIDDIQWDEYPNQCTGKPTAGTISASTSLICGGTGTSNLSLNGQSSGLAGLSFQWKSGTSASGPFVNFGTNVTSISTGVITASKYYKCIATCSSSGISDSTTVKAIIVNPNPNPVITVTPNPVNFCQGSSNPITLKASSTTAKTFSWNPPTGLNRTDTSDVQLLPVASTNYVVTGVDSFGCIGTVNVPVTLRASPFVTITSVDSVMCSGDSLRLTANSGGGIGNTYLWSPTGRTTNFIYAKPLSKTLFSVTVKNNFACSTTVSKNVYVKQKPMAYFGVKVVGPKVNFYDSSLNAVNYEWNFGDGNGSKSQNPIYTFSDAGHYSVQLIVKNPPCKSDTITRIFSIFLSGVNSLHSNSDIEIFPNPSKDLVHITLKSNINASYSVCNSLGQFILDRKINGLSDLLQVSDLPAGIYNIVLRNNENTSYFKFIKI